jgi:hypothetical protein
VPTKPSALECHQPNSHRLSKFTVDHHNIMMSVINRDRNRASIDDFNRIMKHFDNYTNHKSETYKIQYRCRTKDNKYLWIEDRGRVVEWNDDGTVGRMIGAHRDIEAEKTLQQKNQRDKEDLQLLGEARTEELNELNQQLNKKSKKWSN